MKKCLECKKQPNFNYNDKKVGIYCSEHKKENMINVRSKKCLECDTEALFNLPTEKNNGIYCFIHKKENMINVRSKQCLDCNKKENMINITSKKCISGCGTSIEKKYKGYCLRCFIFTFPDEKITRNYKLKEKHVTDFIKETWNNLYFIFDKQIDNGCCKRRPDAYLDLLTHIIIIECDEDQHQTYKNICENKRTMEISNSFANRPIVFIRFNPDSYIKENIKIESSFKINKQSGISVIRNKNEWNNRLLELKKLVNYYLSFIPEKTITNEFLFFDS